MSRYFLAISALCVCGLFLLASFIPTQAAPPLALTPSPEPTRVLPTDTPTPAPPTPAPTNTPTPAPPTNTPDSSGQPAPATATPVAQPSATPPPPDTLPETGGTIPASSGLNLLLLGTALLVSALGFFGLLQRTRG